MNRNLKRLSITSEKLVMLLTQYEQYLISLNGVKSVNTLNEVEEFRHHRVKLQELISVINSRLEILLA